MKRMGLFIHSKPPHPQKPSEYLKQNFFILKKNPHMILPTIAISSKVFAGKKTLLH